MAKPDIDNQIEQIRERLIILQRAAIFCPKFAQRKDEFSINLSFLGPKQQEVQATINRVTIK